jgi:D-arabinose 1-dehydrogenase-like Zn-dependent alcohol dehydrogenase
MLCTFLPYEFVLRHCHRLKQTYGINYAHLPALLVLMTTYVISSYISVFQICPSIEKVFPFSDLPKSYERMKDGHLRGKIVINMNEE